MTTHYAVTTVEQLEDSPVIAGIYFHEFPLAPEITPKHYIDVVSDDPADSNLRPELLAEISNLVREASTAYASHHYHSYHFLLTLSDVAGGEGLEHGQSSDNGVAEKGFADDMHELINADLLPHEFTHSWNGKYRRPDKLYQPDFATPQQGALLWVYEGMTQYMGNVLAARSGLRDAGAVSRVPGELGGFARQRAGAQLAFDRRHRDCKFDRSTSDRPGRTGSAGNPITRKVSWSGSMRTR